MLMVGALSFGSFGGMSRNMLLLRKQRVGTTGELKAILGGYSGNIEYKQHRNMPAMPLLKYTVVCPQKS